MVPYFVTHILHFLTSLLICNMRKGTTMQQPLLSNAITNFLEANIVKCYELNCN